MAIAVLGGLMTSTLLSLLVVPAVFTYADDAKEWLTRVFRRWAVEETAAEASAASVG